MKTRTQSILMNHPFYSINIHFVERPEGYYIIDNDGLKEDSKRHTVYLANIRCTNDAQLRAESPVITEWSFDDEPTSITDPKDALCLLLEHVKKTIANHSP